MARPADLSWITIERMKPMAFRGSWKGYVSALAGVATVTVVLRLLSVSGHVNAATVALALLLVVLFVATWWGARPAVAASVLGVLCFNFFFLPPFGTLTIDAWDNGIALVAFLITAVTVGQLSAHAQRRTEEAEAGRREIERLYEELQDAFERASHAEALKRSEKLKSSLLDAVTHDIRTPLTSIKASVSTLLEELHAKTFDGLPVTLDAETRHEMLEVIDEECDRLNHFVEGLVELARIEAGELHLRRRWGAVDEIVMAALARAESITRRHQVRVEVEDEIPVVQVDPRAVAEVLFTLVDNAAKYSPEGTTILVKAERGGDGVIVISVEDKGYGTPAALRERVFDKFFRATRDGDAGDGRQPKGTGMGLAIAKGIVEAHGGRIWIEEGAEGVGTRVVFILPVGDALDIPEQLTEVGSDTALSAETRKA
jgi:two-component system sensor histidine kinase KdpD